jgi:hypothetical protein
MTWLAWRQHRKQVLFAVIGLLGLAALLVPTGIGEHRAFVDTGLADCLRTMDRAAGAPGGACDQAATAFINRYEGLAPVAVLFVFLPLLVGMFFGAPLVAREVAHGTHRLVGTQGVSRGRWALVKVGLITVTALAVSAAYALLLTWWMEPLGPIAGRMTPLFYDHHGLVPVAYTVFAVALGIFAGTVTRKVLPAMAMTLVGFVALRAVVAILARPNFLPQERRTFEVAHGTPPNRLLGDWVLTREIRDATHRKVGDGFSICSWPDPVPVPDPCDEQYGPGAYNLEIYHPAERFWTFQAIESGLFLALAVILLVWAVYRVRRRIS